MKLESREEETAFNKAMTTLDELLTQVGKNYLMANLSTTEKTIINDWLKEGARFK